MMRWINYWMAELRGHFLRKKRNVVGHNLEEDVMEVFVTKKIDVDFLESYNIIPKYVRIGLKKMKTDVIEVGEIKAQNKVKNPSVKTQLGTGEFRDKVRPLKGGVEIAPKSRLWTGTLGGRVWRDEIDTGRKILKMFGLDPKIAEKLADNLREVDYFITNRHVVLKEYNDESSVSEEMYQPLSQSGTPALKVVAIGKEALDCALLEPRTGIASTDEIMHIGDIKGVKRATVGLEVQKFGRTTGYTKGKCSRTGVTIGIDFGGQTGIKTLRNLDMFSKMSDNGDSGSFICDMEGNVVTLLNAGSIFFTLGVPFEDVVKELQVTRTCI